MESVNMKQMFIKLCLALGFVFISWSSYSQCDILNRIYPDGSMWYYIEPVNFYWTQSKSLKGGIVTDNENFYLGLQPSPFPAKADGKKLKDDLEMKLSNDSTYMLKHFDTRYLEHDSVIQLLYFIDKKDLEEMLKFNALSVRINMQGTEGIRTYVFKLHKDALQEQLSCFLKEKEKKVKK
jgi:hypothetical protein